MVAGVALRQYLFSAVARLVAQIFNLPYRRIIFGRVSDRSQALARCDATQITNLQICDTAQRGWRPNQRIAAQ